jgi:hypothetical protein
MGTGSRRIADLAPVGWIGEVSVLSRRQGEALEARRIFQERGMIEPEGIAAILLDICAICW